MNDNDLANIKKIKVELLFLDKGHNTCLYKTMLNILQENFQELKFELESFSQSPAETLRLRIVETACTEDEFDVRFIVTKYKDSSSLERLQELKEIVLV